MRKIVFAAAALLASSLLAACAPNGALTPEATNTLKAFCVVDGVAQPIAVAVGGAVATVVGFGPEAALAAGIDNQAAHPAVQAACASLGGSPAPDTPSK